MVHDITRVTKRAFFSLIIISLYSSQTQTTEMKSYVD